MAGLNSSTQEMWCPLYADIRVELNSSAWQASMHPLFFFYTAVLLDCEPSFCVAQRLLFGVFVDVSR